MNMYMNNQRNNPQQQNHWMSDANNNLENNQDVTKNGVCKKFLHSKCTKGETCQYSHDISKIRPC